MSFEVFVRAPNPWGHRLKLVARDVARREAPDQYYKPIETGLVGKTDDGREVPVDTIGRLVFGVPGCAGRFIFDPRPDALVARCVWPLPPDHAAACCVLISRVFQALAQKGGES